MAELLLSPFQFEFMNMALITTLVLSLPCAMLSAFLVLKGWSLLGDAMSHAVFPGVVIAWLIGLPYAIGAFVAGMLCAVATGYISENSRIKPDTVMGIVFSGMFGAGLVLYLKLQPEVHLDHILFGDMLGISLADIIQTAAIAVIVSLLIGIKWRDLLLHAFDPNQARACGINGKLMHYGLLCLISLTIVAALKSVGVILSISMLIAPGAIALLLARRFVQVMLLAIGIAMVTGFSGVYASFFLDSAPGPTIVVIYAALFVLAFLYVTVRDRRTQQAHG
ncbi:MULTISPECIES: metal ABC transporter permease [Enterobacterales]|jgi:manganese/iron transport system permease protein|uniref:metal ABC transporter permease n=1 Tax=Enterobacterales TaxID=91347 RepID=UPI00077BA377|nr:MULTISPECIES: metal ABC transporter permease [Enterobacterales]MBB3307326.1 manganese/iron transport system permease protein [Enterobacter sp. Sphag1F]NYI16069.1 manganese/iron transport system permease protein [Enterobacter sp. Sphag71]